MPTADRADAAGWLADHGWRVDAVPSEVEMTRLGRPVPDYEAEEIVASELISAELAEETPMSSLRTHDDTWDIATSVGSDRGDGGRRPRRRDRAATTR